MKSLKNFKIVKLLNKKIRIVLEGLSCPDGIEKYCSEKG